jgi:3-deoxy-D-manno-octulosonic-acid transferase
MIHALYTLGLGAVLAGYTPVALARRVVHGVPLNLRARLYYRSRDPEGAPTGWVHAVSVGEAIAAGPIVEGLRSRYPTLPLVVSTVTETGARIVRERFAGLARHRYFPLDFPGAARRAVDAINPAFLVCIETELWPNVFRALASRGRPVMIANGRLSDRSFRRYRQVSRFMRPVLDSVRVFGMQSDEDARRMIALGAHPERVVVTGNIKNEARPDPPGVADLWHRLLGLGTDERVWIAGSTHRGEEDTILEAHRAVRAEHPRAFLVVAPRHPERVPEVVAAVRSHGFTAVKRSELPSRRAGDAVLVLDTVGELTQLYSIADVVFVGGSLIPAGGHNVLEPALRRKPVLIGPHTTNFRDAVDALTASGAAAVVTDAAGLVAQLRQLFADPDIRVQRGDAGYHAAASRAGAVQATLELVARFLYPHADDARQLDTPTDRRTANRQR